MNDAEEFIPTRQSLLSRLKNSDDTESWKLFFDTYWKLIYNTAVRAGLTETEAQDVVQDTVSSICTKIPNFKYDPKGSFKAWLLRQTCWRIADQFHKRLPVYHSQDRNDDSTRTPTMDRIPDPTAPELEAMWDDQWEKALLDAALYRVKAKVDPKQYQIFDLTMRRNWPIAKVAKDLDITRAEVYLARHRVARLLKKEVQNLRTKPL